MKTARSGRRVAYASPCILKLAQATRDDFSMEPDYLAETRKREWLRTSNAGFAAPKRGSAIAEFCRLAAVVSLLVNS
jgi:hypothetical protein